MKMSQVTYFKLELSLALSVFYFKRDIEKLQRLEKQLFIFELEKIQMKMFFLSI